MRANFGPGSAPVPCMCRHCSQDIGDRIAGATLPIFELVFWCKHCGTVTQAWVVDHVVRRWSLQGPITGEQYAEMIAARSDSKVANAIGAVAQAAGQGRAN